MKTNGRTDSLAHSAENARQISQGLKGSGEPLNLTVDGEVQLVVQSADSYSKMLETVDRAETILGIDRGLRSMESERDAHSKKHSTTFARNSTCLALRDLPRH